MKFLFSSLLFPGLFFDADGGGNSGGSAGGADDQGQNEDQGQEEKPKGRTYTQDELNAMFADRAKRGGEKAITDLLAELEVEDAEVLKNLIKVARDAEAANKTELEKLQDAEKKARDRLAQVEQEKQTEAEKLQTALLNAEIKYQAREKNFRADAIEDVILLMDRSKIELQEDGTYKGVAEALEALAEKKPYLLDDGAEQEKPKGTPKGQAKKNLKVVPSSEDQGKRPTATL